jgi:hypothetical protein
MRRTIATASSIAMLLAGAALLSRVSAGQPAAVTDSRIEAGLRIAPVPLHLAGKNRGLVGLGSYLINASGGCNDCHTCPSFVPGHNPFMGQQPLINVDAYLAGGVPFGPFTSRNLTPEFDHDSRPAGLTFDEFALVLRTGIDLDNAHPPIKLLQVMPWPYYSKMTDGDLLAMYEYLSAIPPRKAPPAGACTGAGQ